MKSITNSRPIIIFFKKSTDLYEFFNSPVYNTQFKDKTQILTEEHAAEKRERVILNAANPNAITLMTRSFGRGTDFQVCDKSIKENGGVHIIHTFLSEDEAE